MITKEEWLSSSIKAQNYNQEGRHFLIEHNMNYRQSHVILAKTSKQAEELLDKVFEKERPELKFCDEIDIKFANKELFMAKRKEELVYDVESFIGEVCREAGRYGKYFGTYPRGFERCTLYEPSDESNLDEDWCKEEHYACKNCINGFKSLSFDQQKLFIANYNGNIFVNDFSDQNTTHCCLIGLGHHSIGAKVVPIDLESYPTGEVNFFFNCLNNQEFKDKIKAKFDTVEEIEKERDLERKETNKIRWEKYEEEEKKKTKKFFEDLHINEI